MDPISALLDELFTEQTLVTLTLSDPRNRDREGCRKVVARPVELRGKRLLQFEYHYRSKVTHRNLPPEEARAHLHALLAEEFRQAQIHTREADVQVVTKASGRPVIRRGPPSKGPSELDHNRKKRYLIPEDQPCDFLQRLGVMTEAGKVVAARYDKFRQINRFLEMVADVEEHLGDDRPLRVVDFGCGKSYLTFALYYYLRDIRGREVRMVGLDLKKDVVAACNRIAQDLDYAGLEFLVGDIQGYHGLEQVDLVVTLHACDTATDDALVKAVQWGARVILSVPCCQHELFRKLRNDTMKPMLKHGIVRERLTALVTDSLRAQLLELSGYRVQMLEFIETEHTAKNILIRAVRQPAAKNHEQLVQEYRAFRDFWGVEPYMQRALGFGTNETADERR